MGLPSSSAAFFLLAVAFSIGWNAVSSELSRFAGLFGNGVLLKMSLAYYIPSVPLLLAAAATDEWFDARFTRHRTQLARIVAGFGGASALLAAFPYLQHSLPQLLAAVAALGVVSSTAFGCSYQLASGCGEGATVALTLGFVCSAPVVLALEAALRLGPSCSWKQMYYLYQAIACVAAAGLVAAVWLAQRQRAWRRLPRPLSSLETALLPTATADELLLTPRQPDAAQGGESELGWMATLAAGESPTAAGALARQLSTAPTLTTGGDMWEDDSVLPDGSSPTLHAIWPAAMALSLSVGSSLFLFPLLTHFPARQLGPMLPVVLFWTRCFADIAGRLLPKACGAPPSAAAVLALALLRVALLPPALLYAHGRLPAALHSDWLLVAYIAFQWLCSGAISVWAYLLLPRLIPPVLMRRATSAMTLTFNSACLAGLLLAIPFAPSAAQPQ